MAQEMAATRSEQPVMSLQELRAQTPQSGVKVRVDDVAKRGALAKLPDITGRD